MCGRAAADDVVQETFLALLEGGTLRCVERHRCHYLFGIAGHHIIRRLEEHGADLVEPSHPTDLSVASANESPFDIVAREQTVAAVREAVESLPPLYREVVVLCDLQDLDASGLTRVGLGRLGFDGATFLVTLVASAGAATMFGLIPAWRASRGDLTGTIKAGACAPPGQGARGISGRTLLIVSETALALVLLTAGGLMLKSVARL